VALICADIKADVDGLGNLGAWIAIHEARKKQLQESIEINQEFIDHFDKNFQPFMDTYSCCRALARARRARRPRGPALSARCTYADPASRLRYDNFLKNMGTLYEDAKAKHLAGLHLLVRINRCLLYPASLPPPAPVFWVSRRHARRVGADGALSIPPCVQAMERHNDGSSLQA